MKQLLLFLCILLSQTALSQTLVKGTVRSVSGPVRNANISVRGSYDGASADSLGNFSFITTESGSQLIVVSALGFAADSIRTEITGKMKELHFTLKKKSAELNEVVISAGTFATGDKGKNTVMNSIDVATTA